MVVSAIPLDRVLGMTPFVSLTPHTITSCDESIGITDQIRQQGCAFVDQELEIGLRSIAAPPSLTPTDASSPPRTYLWASTALAPTL